MRGNWPNEEIQRINKHKDSLAVREEKRKGVLFEVTGFKLVANIGGLSGFSTCVMLRPSIRK